MFKISSFPRFLVILVGNSTVFFKDCKFQAFQGFQVFGNLYFKHTEQKDVFNHIKSEQKQTLLGALVLNEESEEY